MLRMRCLAHGQSFEHRPSASKCPEAAAVLPDCLQLSKQASSQPGIECPCGTERGESWGKRAARQGCWGGEPASVLLPYRVSPIPGPPHGVTAAPRSHMWLSPFGDACSLPRLLGGFLVLHRPRVGGPSFPKGRYSEWGLGSGMCPSWPGAAGIGALAANTEAQHCLLGQKADLLACLPPCQLVTLPGDSTTSGKSLCLWFPSDFCGLAA